MTRERKSVIIPNLGQGWPYHHLLGVQYYANWLNSQLMVVCCPDRPAVFTSFALGNAQVELLSEATGLSKVDYII